jgi:16S rRNA (cytidine1402-2'-O)-methyltransferase
MERVNDRAGKAGGTLMLAAAPIGRPEDASPRLAAALGEAPVIAAEDTRRLRRPAVVCRELTKTHEEIRRGTLGELSAWAASGQLGEITIVVAGAPPRRADPADFRPRAAARVAALEQAGTARKAAIAEVARELGVRKRDVYDAILASKPG